MMTDGQRGAHGRFGKFDKGDGDDHGDDWKLILGMMMTMTMMMIRKLIGKKETVPWEGSPPTI